jgi:hypothetical protein
MKVHLAVIKQPEKSTVLRYQPTSIETLIVQSTISQSCAREFCDGYAAGFARAAAMNIRNVELPSGDAILLYTEYLAANKDGIPPHVAS